MSRGISQIQSISRNETSDSLYADDKEILSIKSILYILINITYN